MRNLTLIIAVYIISLANTLAVRTYDVSIDELSKIDMPIVVIQTINDEYPTFEKIDCPPGCWGVGITNATKVPGRLLIIQQNDTIYDSGDFVEKESGMTIKVRGNTSAFKDKKPYKIKLQKKADLLCRGDKSFNDKNWVLLRKEKLLWDVGFAVSRLLEMQWTPSYRYVNFILNGKYEGVYMLAEAVERNPKCRLNVEDTGFVFEYDSYWWNEDLFVESSTASPMNYTFKYPDSDEITDDQLSYFKDMINTVEQSVFNGTYPDYIDLNSFASWILAQDILGNRSGGGSNVYLTKYDNSPSTKVMMGNLWDFDRIFLMNDSWSGCRGVFLWPYLFDNPNPEFVDSYVSKWNQVKDWIFDDVISYMIDFMNSAEGKALDESLLIDESLWNEQNGSVGDNVEIAKEWLKTRKRWMSDEINKMSTIILNQIDDDTRTKTRDRYYYDLIGRKIAPTPFGVYIHNNKKVILK